MVRDSHRLWAITSIAAILACTACQDDTSANEDRPWSTDELALVKSLSPVPAPPPSPGNHVADDPRAAAFGHRLFFDERLSRNGEVSCATCHDPQQYFTDGKPVAVGLSATTKNSPTVMTAHYVPFVFWDGRADSVWSQALGPLEDEREHGLTRLEVVRVIAEHHGPEYEAIFGELPDLDNEARFPPSGRPMPDTPRHAHNMAWAMMTRGDQKAVNTVFANVGKAMEAYQRKLAPRPAPFDEYVEALSAGKRTDGIISKSAERGLRSFVGNAQCVSCHNGPLLTDGAFHNLGLPPERNRGTTIVDLGRSVGAVDVKEGEFSCGSEYSDAEKCDELEFLNPRFEDFQGAFKTPSLRNVAKTAPYMHTGQFASLTDVVTFYKTLPGKPVVGHRELVLTLLSQDVSTEDLVAFLETLTGPLPDDKWLHPPGPLDEAALTQGDTTP